MSGTGFILIMDGAGDAGRAAADGGRAEDGDEPELAAGLDREGLGESRTRDPLLLSEKDAKLAQKLGQLQPFYSCIPT